LYQPNKEEKQEKKPYEYICFHRPLFDVDGENWRKWSEGKAERLESNEVYKQLYTPGHNEEKKKHTFAGSPSEHKDHKWVIMWSAWLKFKGFCRRAKYCDPVAFGMQEIVDHAVSPDNSEPLDMLLTTNR
jgi:hypothetical protein